MKQTNLELVAVATSLAVKNLTKFTDNYAEDVYLVTEPSQNSKQVLKIFTSAQHFQNELAVSQNWDSGNMQVSDFGTINPNCYYLLRAFLPGKPLLEKQVNEQVAWQIGKQLAQLHQLKLPAGTRLTEQPVSDLFEHWFSSASHFFTPDQQNQIRQSFSEKNQPYIDDQLVVAHMDYRLGNLLLNAQGLQIIDFGSVKLTNRFFDFKKIRTELLGIGPKLWLQFCRGYQQTSGIDLTMVEATSKIDFFGFLHGIGGLAFAYNSAGDQTAFIAENKQNVLEYIDG